MPGYYAGHFFFKAKEQREFSFKVWLRLIRGAFRHGVSWGFRLRSFCLASAALSNRKRFPLQSLELAIAQVKMTSASYFTVASIPLRQFSVRRHKKPVLLPGNKFPARVLRPVCCADFHQSG